MHLLDISVNVFRPESPTRKRSLEQYLDSKSRASNENQLPPPPQTVSDATEPAACESVIQRAPCSPAQSSPPSLTDNGSTPVMESTSPTTPSQPIDLRIPSVSGPPSPTPPSQTPLPLTTTTTAPPPAAPSLPSKTPAGPPVGAPPAKRVRLTDAEKELKRLKDEEDKKAKAEEKEKKLKVKAKAEEEKKAKLEEREKKRREKEEEARKAQEAKERKERSQLKLGSFFKTGPSTPVKKAPAPATAPVAMESPLQAVSAGHTPQKPPAVDNTSDYDKVFKPFFIRNNVTLARDPFEMDEAAKQLKTKTLEEFIFGVKQCAVQPFTGAASVEYFNLAKMPAARGRPYPSVRKIMTMLSEADGAGNGSSSAPIDLEAPSKSQNPQARRTARQLLREVPMKYIFFSQDVRPAYYGTISTLPPSGNMRRLARRPISRDILPLQYDYDSEAEWVDDGEGEDIDGADEEEEELDEDEDMDDFLDDSEDVSKRPLFASGMEPESTGLCFHDGGRIGPGHPMYQYRLEVIPDLEHGHSIDPFSTRYWEPEPKPAVLASGSTTAAITTGWMPPPSGTASASAGPGGAFATLAQGAAASSAGKKTASLVPPETMDDLKQAILKYPKLSKVGLVELLSTELSKCTRAQIKYSIEAIAERAGAGRDKAWRIKTEYAS